jgi:hypothetical protein
VTSPPTLGAATTDNKWERVVEQQRQEQPVAVVERDRQAQAAEIGHEIAVRQHHALAARGTRCEDDGREVVWPDGSRGQCWRLSGVGAFGTSAELSTGLRPPQEEADGTVAGFDTPRR